MTHGPILPVGAGLSGGYSGASWTMRLTIRDRIYSYTHASLWVCIREIVRMYDAEGGRR